MVATFAACILFACSPSYNQDTNLPDAAGTFCRVTIQNWKGTAESHVRGQRSDVAGFLGSSTAVVERGADVVIKGWLGNTKIGRLEGDRFVLSMWGEDFPSDPYADGQTAFTWNGPMGPDTQVIQSDNCTNDELGLGGAHLIALAAQSPTRSHRPSP